MNRETAMAKFEDKVKQINEAIKGNRGNFFDCFAYDTFTSGCEISIATMSAFELIYDIDKLNEYAKKALENIDIYDPNDADFSYLEDANNLSQKVKQIRTYATSRKKHPHHAIKYIFWALFLLAVDNTDYDKHLSEICDIAIIMGLDNNDIHDIALAVKYALFNDDRITHEIKSEKVIETFADWIPGLSEEYFIGEI